MAGAQAGAGIAVEVFVEQNQVTPVRIVLELFPFAEGGPGAVAAAQEDVIQAARKIRGHFPQRDPLAGARGALYLVLFAREVMKLLERFDQKIIDRKPNRPAP